MNGRESSNQKLESDLWLDRLEKLANQRAAESESLSDLEKAASAALLIAEARKGREELQHQSYRLRLDEAKSWALLAVPFLILICMLVFLPRPNQQAAAMREANADAQFREVEKTFLSQVTQVGTLARPDLLLLTTPLQPYLNDQRYGKETLDVSLLALAHANSSDAFQDFFVSRNIRLGSQNLSAILTLDRMLYTNFNELDDALNSESASNANTTAGRQRTRDATLMELTFLSGKVAAYFRQHKSAPLDLDLRRVYLKGVDLSGVAFGKSDLEGCQWEGVSLANADLSTVAGFDNSQWIDANWWDARSVAKPLLNYLIANQYPYHPPVVEYTNAPAGRDVYEQKVMKLCAAARANCEAAHIPYGTPLKSDKHAKT